MAERPDLEARAADHTKSTMGNWCQLDAETWPCDASTFWGMYQDALSSAASLERAAEEREQQRLAYAKQVLIATQALRDGHAADLAQAERERDELRAAIDGAWETTQATLQGDGQ